MIPTTPTPTDVTDEDRAYLGDLLDLQHHAVRLCRLAETRSPRRDIRALAHAESRAQRQQIAAVTSCLLEWAPVAPRAVEVADSSVRAWMAPTADTDTLSHVVRSDFDDRFLGLLATHHRAALDRSRAELVGGLSHRSRAFAQTAVTHHAAALDALDSLGQLSD